MSTMTTTRSQTSTETSEPRKSAGRISEPVSALKEDLTAAKNDAGELISAASECATEELERAKQIAATGGERATEYHKAMSTLVRKHPTAAVLVTAGAGIMLGKLLSR